MSDNIRIPTRIAAIVGLAISLTSSSNAFFPLIGSTLAFSAVGAMQIYNQQKIQPQHLGFIIEGAKMGAIGALAYVNSDTVSSANKVAYATICVSELASEATDWLNSK